MAEAALTSRLPLDGYRRTIGTVALAEIAGLALVFSVLSAFSGVVADPVQRRLGRHRRLLERLVAALGRSLRGGGPGRFAVRDHWIARLLDVVDLLRTAWSKLH